jgi:hypothetical protein
MKIAINKICLLLQQVLKNRWGKTLIIAKYVRYG